MSSQLSAVDKRRPRNLVTSNAVMPSTSDGTSAFIERLQRMLTRYKFSDGEIASIRASVEEALKNSVLHGNKSNPKKSVHVIFSIGPREFSIRIQDEGTGFDWRHAESSGRGLSLMRRHMTHVRFNSKGNIVTFVLKRGHICDKLDDGRY